MGTCVPAVFHISRPGSLLAFFEEEAENLMASRVMAQGASSHQTSSLISYSTTYKTSKLSHTSPHFLISPFPDLSWPQGPEVDANETQGSLPHQPRVSAGFEVGKSYGKTRPFTGLLPAADTN
jgi:hypothetical protein